MPDATETIGQRLRAQRVLKSLTLAQVAERSGLSLPYVSNLERGLGNPTLDALTALTLALGVSLADLVSDEELRQPLDIALANAPKSLLQFARSTDFQEQVARIAERLNQPTDLIRQKILSGMISSPRRSSGNPTEDDWRRILDAYSLILQAGSQG